MGGPEFYPISWQAGEECTLPAFWPTPGTGPVSGRFYGQQPTQLKMLWEAFIALHKKREKRQFFGQKSCTRKWLFSEKQQRKVLTKLTWTSIIHYTCRRIIHDTTGQRARKRRISRGTAVRTMNTWSASENFISYASRRQRDTFHHRTRLRS